MDNTLNKLSVNEVNDYYSKILVGLSNNFSNYLDEEFGFVKRDFILIIVSFILTIGLGITLGVLNYLYVRNHLYTALISIAAIVLIIIEIIGFINICENYYYRGEACSDFNNNINNIISEYIETVFRAAAYETFISLDSVKQFVNELREKQLQEDNIADISYKLLQFPNINIEEYVKTNYNIEVETECPDNINLKELINERNYNLNIDYRRYCL